MRFLVNNRNPHGGVTYHRIQRPFHYLSLAGHEVDYFYNPAEIPNKDYDYLVFNRSMGWNSDKQDEIFIDAFKRSGGKVIIDLDDYWNLPEYHTIKWRPDVDYNEWRSNILNNLKRADYCWTSTEFLKEKIVEERPDIKIAVAKNAVDYNQQQWLKSFPIRKYPNKVNIGWVGSTTHHKDLDQLRRPVKAVIKRFRKKVHFHLTGITADKNNWSFEVNKRFFDNFSNNGAYGKNVTCWKPLRVNEYPFLYDQFDISIAAVIDNDFNRAKSELKIIEAGAKYLPFVGSNTLTYSRANAKVHLCSTPQEWVDSLVYLVSNKEARIKEGKELGEYVRDVYTFEKANQARLSVL